MVGSGGPRPAGRECRRQRIACTAGHCGADSDWAWRSGSWQVPLPCGGWRSHPRTAPHGRRLPEQPGRPAMGRKHGAWNLDSQMDRLARKPRPKRPRPHTARRPPIRIRGNRRGRTAGPTKRPRAERRCPSLTHWHSQRRGHPHEPTGQPPGSVTAGYAGTGVRIPTGTWPRRLRHHLPRLEHPAPDDRRHQGVHALRHGYSRLGPEHPPEDEGRCKGLRVGTRPLPRRGPDAGALRPSEYRTGATILRGPRHRLHRNGVPGRAHARRPLPTTRRCWTNAGCARF